MIARRAAIVGIGAGLSPAAWRFRAALRDPRRSQRRVLERLTRRLRATEYGRHLGVRTPDDFLARVPVVDHDELLPWLERQRRTEGRVLTPEPVLFYEKTSGSSGAAKYIPYTASLRRSFSRTFAVWVADLIRRGPRFSSGKLYISVSPAFSHEDPTERGVPVGMDDDRDYLDGWLRRLVSPFVVGSPELARARDVEAFKRRTCACLVGEADLEVLSIWNPSFLTVLLDDIAARRDDLAVGLSPARRAALLSDPIDWSGVWPHLALISCWAAASAAPGARALERMFPHALVQGKGLLATEAPITVPLVDAPGDLPVLDEILIELEDSGGRLLGLHEAEAGREYGVVVSQSGGLYRYRMGDRVRVGPRYLGTPCLSFVGRDGGVSDLVGEKLGEDFVAEVLADVEPEASFKTLVPVREPLDHYVLVLDRPVDAPRRLAAELDRRLARTHHYQHARALGQLGPPRVRFAAGAAALATRDGQRRGLKLGDIKPRALETDPHGAIAALAANEPMESV